VLAGRRGPVTGSKKERPRAGSLGAFGRVASQLGAAGGWLRSSPAHGRLRAVVVGSRLTKGRELGLEVGYYAGCLDVLRSQPDLPERLVRVHRLHGLDVEGWVRGTRT
jgi:hypothetical protein